MTITKPQPGLRAYRCTTVYETEQDRRQRPLRPSLCPTVSEQGRHRSFSVANVCYCLKNEGL